MHFTTLEQIVSQGTTIDLPYLVFALEAGLLG